jgi:hypothetical protein
VDHLHNEERIHVRHNATTSLLHEVIQAVTEFRAGHFRNPGTRPAKCPRQEVPCFTPPAFPSTARHNGGFRVSRRAKRFSRTFGGANRFNRFCLKGFDIDAVD